MNLLKDKNKEMNYATKQNYNASQHDAKLNPWTAHPTFYLANCCSKS